MACVVGGECGRLGGDANLGVADGAVVAFVAANAPRCLGGNGPPVDVHGMQGVDECVVFGLGAAVGHEGVGAAPDGEPGQVQEGNCVGAMQGWDEAALPKLGVEACDVEHLGQVGARLKRV